MKASPPLREELELRAVVVGQAGEETAVSQSRVWPRQAETLADRRAEAPPGGC